MQKILQLMQQFEAVQDGWVWAVFRLSGSGFRGLRFRVQGLGFRGSGVQGFRGLGFRLGG